ncbi:MAG: nitroreductase family protein [Clostridia bacterium]|nr:nitroreductase family protein [Clostridia bacterium]
MNQTLELIKNRKSVRIYTEQPISAEDKRIILDAAIQAPSAGNMTMFTILDITDPEMKAKLAESCDHQAFIANAPMVLVFCADVKRWMDVFKKYVGEVRNPAEGDLLLAQQDTLIAAQNAAVAAEALGIGTCYIGDIIENFEYHRELLNLPNYVVPTGMLCFGYPTQQQIDRPKPPRFTIESIVHENGYDQEKNDMAEMLKERHNFTEEALADWVQRFCKRKWNSDFSREMSRSSAEIIKYWTKDKE